MCHLLHPELRAEKEERKDTRVVYQPKTMVSAPSKLHVQKTAAEVSAIPVSIAAAYTEVYQMIEEQNAGPVSVGKNSVGPAGGIAVLRSSATTVMTRDVMGAAVEDL